eukprot:TRINITY_DN34931_c0_g1_i1.p1 TRINITY_DN34931_c0_g1~~TRINITY_DN34931_c0_g1_i1.p1  ORF type:complete len:159 (+),score=18.00 TRINITY_DN34931_c0_g1_i1:48-479(+)
MAVHTGGSPSFMEMDDARVALNRDALNVLSDASKTNCDKLDHLAQLSGKIFNLNNTVPSDVGAEVQAAVSALVISTNQQIEAEPNRSLAQLVLDIAGPGPDAGLMNCGCVANGWVYTNVLSEEAKSAVLAVHARQWGGAGRDK